jgi:hypothetical protein
MVNPMFHYSWLDKNPGPYRVGDRVAFRFGSADVVGVIIEDRGPLGRGRKRVYGIEFLMDDVSPAMYIELEYDDFRLVESPGSSNGN